MGDSIAEQGVPGIDLDMEEQLSGQERCGLCCWTSALLLSSIWGKKLHIDHQKKNNPKTS